MLFRQTDVRNKPKYQYKIDNGDLSEETYRAIMIEAEMFNHHLTLQFGLFSGECEDEDNFIKKSLELIEGMKKYDEIDIDDMFFGKPSVMKDFHNALRKNIENIKQVNKIPHEKRSYLYG